MDDENRFAQSVELRKENRQGEAGQEGPMGQTPPGYENQSSGYGNQIPPPQGYGNQPPPWYGRQTAQTSGTFYWQEPIKSESVGFGIASLVLGILSLLLFCTCINWLTGILAIIFGIIQIVKSEKKGLAIGGIVTAAISILFTIVFYIVMFYMGVGYGSYGDYYDYYDYYNDYYDDFYSSDQEEFL